MNKKLIIKVTELCTYENEDTEQIFEGGNRVYHYESDKPTFEEAVKDIEENFNSDNIIYSNDDFDGSCLDSIVTGYELI